MQSIQRVNSLGTTMAIAKFYYQSRQSLPKEYVPQRKRCIKWSKSNTISKHCNKHPSVYKTRSNNKLQRSISWNKIQVATKCSNTRNTQMQLVHNILEGSFLQAFIEKIQQLFIQIGLFLLEVIQLPIMGGFLFLKLCLNYQNT